MILYQFATWMDERQRLADTIRASGDADISFLQQKKEQVEQKMLHQANLWMQPMPMLAAVDGAAWEAEPSGVAATEFGS